MTNYVGYPYDPLSADVVLHYPLRFSLSDSGTGALADVTLTDVGATLQEGFLWPNKSVGGVFTNHSAVGYIKLPTGSVPNVANGEWTLDFWAYGRNWNDLSAVTTGFAYIDAEESAGSANTLHIGTSNLDDSVGFTVLDSSGINFSAGGTTQMVNDTAHFFSLCRKGNIVYLYIDGVLEASVDVTSATGFNFNATATPFAAFGSDAAVTQGLDGVFADIRWTNAARYDGSNFEPPISPFTSGSSNPLDASDTLKVRSFGIELDGHDSYVLRCGQQGTFVFDLETQQWSEWATSGYSSSWNAIFGLSWNKEVVVADQSNPILWKLNPGGFYDEDTLDLTRTVTGVFKVTGREFIPCNSLQLTASVGNPNPDSAANPTVSLSFSDDGGNTFSTPDSIGLTVADYNQQLWWSSLGAMGDPGRIFRIVDVGGLVRIDDAQLEIG